MVKRPLGVSCLAVVLVLTAAVWLAPDFADTSHIDYEEFQGQTVTVTGRVCKKETVRQSNGPALVIYLKQMKNNDDMDKTDTGPPGDKIMCYLSFGEAEPELGSIVKLSGKLYVFEKASNPGQFDTRSYYQISGISYRLNQATILTKTTQYWKAAQMLYVFRLFLSEKFSSGLPGKEASVMQTMLLGEKGGMEKELKELYQKNGIAHILAISGLHISLIGTGLYLMLRKCGIPMKAAAVISAGIIFLYGAMTGFSVSAVRAVCMFLLQMLSILFERTYDMLTAAAVAAVLILLKQPLYLNHSGFLFSFGCVLGIGLILPLLTNGNKEMPEAAKGLLSGIGMAVITLPVYLWFYYQFPVYSVFLNFLVIPLMSLLMAAGLLFLVCQIFLPPAAVPFAFFIKGVLMVYEKACGICEALPGNLFTPGKPESWQMVFYLLMLVFLIIMKEKLKLAVRWAVVFLGVLVLIMRPGKGFQMVFLDVGQGDCIYIENENKSRYLVDGGSSSVGSVGKYRIIPFLKSQGASYLDAVFVTHPDEDHCNGIKELLEEGEGQGITVRHLVLPDISENARNENYLELVKASEEARIPVSYISRGQMIKSGNLSIKCLHPSAEYTSGEPNEYSIVLGLIWRDFSAILTGDVEENGERQLIQKLEETPDFKEITVLKVAHHGSKYSTDDDFLQVVHPYFSVISAGRNNKYGHPHRELLQRLEKEGSLVYETSKSGAVTIWMHGKRVWIRTFL